MGHLTQCVLSYAQKCCLYTANSIDYVANCQVGSEANNRAAINFAMTFVCTYVCVYVCMYIIYVYICITLTIVTLASGRLLVLATENGLHHMKPRS